METVAETPQTQLQGSTPHPEVGIAVGEEYRRDERYPVNGDAEVVVLGGTSLFRGRIMDISVSGCYIQTLAWIRLKPETPVEILFAVDGKVVRAIAASRYVKSKVGIGFRFLKMNEDMQRKLDELIDDARTRFMQLTRQAKGLSSAPLATPSPTPRLPASPLALHVVAEREQERAASAPAAKLSSRQPSSPAAASALAQSQAPNQAPLSFSPVVEEAAVAVASLEQDAAGVQASQMLEVSELSKTGAATDPPIDDAPARAPAAVVEEYIGAEAQTKIASPPHAFEVDEDASDVGHAEIWSASSGMAQWQSPPTAAQAEASTIAIEIAVPESDSVFVTPEISVEPKPEEDAPRFADSEPVAEQALLDEHEPSTMHRLHSESEGSPGAAIEELPLEDPFPIDPHSESLSEFRDELPLEADAEPAEAVVPPMILDIVEFNEGDSTPYAHMENSHADASAKLQQFEELIHGQADGPDERAQGSNSQFSVLGD